LNNGCLSNVVQYPVPRPELSNCKAERCWNTKPLEHFWLDFLQIQFTTHWGMFHARDPLSALKSQT